jgi:ABC-type bacteriocin/lantibiotic exporter with double-glycine peptidase domain
MVLTKSPKILILDEPTSALDEESESEFWDLISELIPDYTIIVVTHKLKYLREYFNIIKLSKDNFFESGKWIKYKKLI